MVLAPTIGRAREALTDPIASEQHPSLASPKRAEQQGRLVLLALSWSASFLSRVNIVQDSAEHYPNRGNGGEIIKDTEDPRLWRVYWMGGITFPKFPCRVTAFRYLNQLRQGKRRPEQPI
jgi:hypothetical protein